MPRSRRSSRRNEHLGGEQLGLESELVAHATPVAASTNCSRKGDNLNHPLGDPRVAALPHGAGEQHATGVTRTVAEPVGHECPVPGPTASVLPPKRAMRTVALPASQVIARPIAWLWPRRIPFGELTILAGDPGLGKSLLASWLMAQLSRGKFGEARNGLLLTAEDSLEHTVRPRLEAARADLDRAGFAWVERDGITTPFMLPTDVNALRSKVSERKAGLVVIDPLAAHLAVGVNSWKDTEVRTALAPLSVLAKETGAAILVVAHLNKGQSEDPLQRLGGSIGIPAAARSVLLLTRDPDDPEGDQGSRRVLAHVRSNLGPVAKGVRFEIEAATVGHDRGEKLETARMLDRGECPYSGAELLAAPRAERGAKLREAVAFLTAELAESGRPVKDVLRAAEELGISEQTLRRARDELGIESERVKHGWIWVIPAPTGDGTQP
jgi:AAA domain